MARFVAHGLSSVIRMHHNFVQRNGVA